ncbi:type II CAAX endopeptidase family protein [Flavobacteriaceae bacterium KMM 6898]|nr:type II CAAX endopeptidase family protein [Flavobacteriaceae bacterium KMM 6898]
MTKPKVNNYPNIIQSFGITGFIILIMIMLSLIIPTLNKLVGSETSTLLFEILAMGIPFLIVTRIIKKKASRKSFKLVLKNKRIIPFIIAAGVALLLGVVSPITSLIPMPESIKIEFIKAASQTGIITFIYMVIAAPILEELIFRGIILDGLLKKHSPIISILISSVLFGIVHLSPWSFVTGLIMGIFTGWVYYKSKSLLATIIIHASANITGYLSRFFIDSSTIDQSFTESLGGTTNLILVITCSILIISICVYSLKKEFNKASQFE